MNELLEAEVEQLPDGWSLVTVGQLVNEGVIAERLDGNQGEIHTKGSDFVSDGISLGMKTDINVGKVDLVNCKFITKKQTNSCSLYNHLGKPQ